MTNSESKACQNCQFSFFIDAQDFDFYRKIDVPPPTFCPECRFARKYVWRNHRALYKRKCQAPGHTEEMISIYHPGSPFIVYDRDYWWSDKWDPMDYGQ